MITANHVMFADALDRATRITRGIIPILSRDLTLVRDFMGRIHVLLPGGKQTLSPMQQQALTEYLNQLTSELGAYASDEGVHLFFGDEMFLGEGFVEHPDRQLLENVGEHAIWLLDRQLTGQDWLRAPLKRTSNNPRFTFFGIKGGVGRSTALAIWAWRLAQHGKRVLVFDLDLESPGVSSTLLPPDALPDYGIVDWFVEDSVGQADIIESEMTAASPVSRESEGDVLIVPAYGKKTGDYLPKLARCYTGQPDDIDKTWADRLNRLILRLEEHLDPDVVIFDSRAGIHDIAAVLVTRLDAYSLLFAVDAPQTWAAYAMLFLGWRRHPALDSFRDRIQLVASMIPETEQEEYKQRLLEKAWDTFREGLYDEVSVPGRADPAVTEPFSFDHGDKDAPHYPWPIYWQRALQEFNPSMNNDWSADKMIDLAFGELFIRLDTLLAVRREGA